MKKDQKPQEDYILIQVVLRVIKLHHPVAPSTVAKWLRSVMEKVNVDTSIFKAHPARGAAVTPAANAGITTVDILKTADWSSDSVQTHLKTPSCFYHNSYS